MGCEYHYKRNFIFNLHRIWEPIASQNKSASKQCIAYPGSSASCESSVSF